MAYLPDPSDATQPVASVKASTAAAEFRALKAYIATLAGLSGNPSFASLTVQQLNGGQLAGVRNRVRNSGCQITQRAAGTLSATPTLGAVDGYYWSSTGSGVSGNIQQVSTSQFLATTLGSGIVGSWTTGAPQVEQRIESTDTRDLDGKIVTISCRLFHNIGSTVPFRIQLNRPSTTEDDFSAQTVLATGVAADCPTGVGTLLSMTVDLAGQDVSKGLAIQVYATANSTGVGSIVAISELAIVPGSAVTPFEHIPLALELARCQRYYEFGSHEIWSGYTVITHTYYHGPAFKVTKRTVPSVATTYIAASGFPASPPVVAVAYPSSFYGSSVADATVNGGFYRYSWTASAEL